MLQTETAPWLLFRAWNTDGTPKSDLVYNAAGIVLYQSRNNEAKSTITLSNAASATDWAAGKFWQISGNLYRVGASTASISAYTGFITVQGSYTGGTLDGIAIEVRLAPATPTDVTDAVASLTSFPSSGPVERSPNDTKAIAFSWPVSGATITADVSLDNAAYAACTGTVSFLRTEGSSHYYSLAYHADDRPTAEGTARYQLDDGTYTQYFTLRVEGASTDAAGIRSAVGLSAANLDTQLGDILGDTNELQTNQGDWVTATSVTVSDKTGFSIAGTINTLDALDTAQDVQHAATQSTLSTISTNVSTLLDRVTTTVVTLWANLTAMITGSGVTAKYTTTALENAPAVGDGGLTLSPEDKQSIINGTINGVLAVKSRIPDSVAGLYRSKVGDTWQQTFELAAPAADRIILAVKDALTDSDNDSILLIDTVTGLLRVKGAAATDAAQGTLTSDGETIELLVSSTVMKELSAARYKLIVKALDVGNDTTLEYDAVFDLYRSGIEAISP
jgi:hypothetical protein